METDKPKKRGRWKAGESGNQKGRQPGTGVTQKLREGISEHIPEIIAQLVRRAKAGDSQAARLLLKRVLPPMKAAEQPVTLSLPEHESMSAQGIAIVHAVAAGKIAPGQAAALLGGLAAVARIKELDELEDRVRALENGST
jgi:hypothetical protein